MDGGWIETGRVRSVHPARRELRIRPYPAHAHEFEEIEWLHLMQAAEKPLRYRIAAIQDTGAEIIVQLGAGISRDSIAGFKGASVVVAETEQRPRPEGVWFMPDLDGMAVSDKDDRAAGTVTAVYETAANGAIEITKPDGAVILLPVIDAVIREIDLESRIIRLNDIEAWVVES